MSGWPLNVFFLIVICVPSLFALRCNPPQQRMQRQIEQDDSLKKEYGELRDFSNDMPLIDNSDENLENSPEMSSNPQTSGIDESKVNEGYDLLTILQSKRPKGIRKQKSFIRNPNYISANKRFDKLAENMYMLELPKPHPGALAGSSRGCDVVDDGKKTRFVTLTIKGIDNFYNGIIHPN